MAKLEAFITTIQIYSEQLRKVADVLDRVEKDKMNEPEYLQA